MNTYHSPGHRPVQAKTIEESADIFAGRKAKAAKCAVRCWRLVDWNSNHLVGEANINGTVVMMEVRKETRHAH
jgi:hypothetical protein